MNRIRAILLFLLLVVLCTATSFRHAAAAPVEPKSITLDEAVRIGLERSRSLQIARLDRDMAGQKIRQTWSEVLPQITSSFTYTRTLKPTVLLLPDQGFPGFPTKLETSSDNAGHATLDVRQPLFNLSALAGINAAGIVRKMSEEAYRNTQAAVVADIKISYFDALISKGALPVIDFM